MGPSQPSPPPPPPPTPHTHTLLTPKLATLTCHLHGISKSSFWEKWKNNVSNVNCWSVIECCFVGTPFDFNISVGNWFSGILLPQDTSCVRQFLYLIHFFHKNIYVLVIKILRWGQGLWERGRAGAVGEGVRFHILGFFFFCIVEHLLQQMCLCPLVLHFISDWWTPWLQARKIFCQLSSVNAIYF